MLRKAFTLMEVNLAIMVMAGGILSVVVLYSLGFRESRQSSEDVASAAYADAVMSPLVMAITSTNLKWSVFNNLNESYPSSSGNEFGWGAYIRQGNGQVKAKGEISSLARRAFQDVMSALRPEGGDVPGTRQLPEDASGDLLAGLVVLHEKDSPIVKIAFRATKLPGMLLASPLYYTEARFQGIVDTKEGR